MNNVPRLSFIICVYIGSNLETPTLAHITLQGRIQDFHLGGRGRKRLCVLAHYIIYIILHTMFTLYIRARNGTHFRQGSRACLRALEAL